jgi:hypothetical protein
MKPVAQGYRNCSKAAAGLGKYFSLEQVICLANEIRFSAHERIGIASPSYTPPGAIASLTPYGRRPASIRASSVLCSESVSGH